MGISVVIPSYRNPSYLDLCLKSLFENQDGDNEIIAVLDGFGEESKHVIKKYPKLNVLEFEENKGQTYAHNHGVINASSEYVLIINDDNVAPRHWDTKLERSKLNRTVIAPNQIEPTPSIFQSFVINDLGKTPEEFKYDAFLDLEEITSKPLHGMDGQTWPIFISKRHFMMVGGIDPYYPSPAVADWDLFMKLEMAGLVCNRWFGCHFYHFAGAATRKVDSNWNVKELQSHQYFQYKWGYSGNLNSTTHSKFPGADVVRGVRFR
jgi:glycosyltransferase involved in cell wall biosynthesis